MAAIGFRGDFGRATVAFTASTAGCGGAVGGGTDSHAASGNGDIGASDASSRRSIGAQRHGPATSEAGDQAHDGLYANRRGDDVGERETRPKQKGRKSAADSTKVDHQLIVDTRATTDSVGCIVAALWRHQETSLYRRKTIRPVEALPTGTNLTRLYFFCFIGSEVLFC